MSQDIHTIRPEDLEELLAELAREGRTITSAEVVYDRYGGTAGYRCTVGEWPGKSKRSVRAKRSSAAVTT